MYVWLIVNDMTSAEQAPGPLTIWIAIAVLVAVLGAGLTYLSARVYAKVLFSFVAVILIIVGYFMLIFAPAYRQINDPGIAEYQAFNMLLLFGGITVAAGIGLAVACVYWALKPHALRRLNRWRRTLGAIYGIVLGLAGLSMLLLLLAAADSAEFDDAEGGVTGYVISITTFAMTFFVPGVLLTYHGISSAMGEGSDEFRPPVGALIVAAFLLVVGAGYLNMSRESPIAAVMPFLHTLGAVLPGVAYVAFAARGSALRGVRVRGLTWRQVTLAWGLAIAIGAMSAGFVNSVGGLGVTVLMLVQNGAFEGVHSVSSDFAYDVFDVISDADYILSNREQWVANIIAIAIIPPLGEEFLKGLGVRFLMRRNTTRAQAFALGAAAGAGFGFVEALLYGAGVTINDLGDWWLIMVIRAGSSSLHCLNTGLVGLAWWHWSIARRHRTALALFGTAVLYHGLWNGLSVTLDSEIFWLDTLQDSTIEKIAYAFVAVCAAALIVAIPIVARILREPQPPSVAGTPLASMTPWVA